MNYMFINKIDTANGKGVRVSLFVAGCRQHCEGCFSQNTWDFSAGQPFTKETEEILIQNCAPSYIKGLSILGGNPTEPENEECLIPFVERFKETYQKKDIWMWTGNLAEELIKRNDKLFQLCDVVIDGPFILAQRDITLAFRGSGNQRIIDVGKTIRTGKIVTLDL